MKRIEPDSPEARQRSTAAAEWLARRDRGLTATEQDEFLQWLAADPRHGDWLALHRHVVADFTALAHWRPEHSEEANPDLLAPVPARNRWLRSALLAAAAIVVVLLVLQWPRFVRSRDVAGPELARRLLEDGSAVELNRGSAVMTAFTAQERTATVVNGAAYFTVAKNPSRPFIVHAGGVAIRAVGTAFSVRLDAGEVEVLVTEGRVAVTRENIAAAKTAADTAVDAGQRAIVSRLSPAMPQIAPASGEEISRLREQQPQLLDFSSAPLAVAAAEFNRHNRVQFEIADAELTAMPVIASIRSDNVEGFAEFLAATPGVEIERRGADRIVVRRRK